MRSISLVVLTAITATLCSCCDPTPRQSFPQVINGSYMDTAIKDAGPTIPPSSRFDSLFYPIYSFNIKNSGSEADSFSVVFSREKGFYDIFIPQKLTVTEFVNPGETKTFRTYGPLPRNAADSARYRYVSFFVSVADSIPISMLRPTITIFYGGTEDGPESCGAPPRTLQVNIDSLIN